MDLGKVAKASAAAKVATKMEVAADAAKAASKVASKVELATDAAKIAETASTAAKVAEKTSTAAKVVDNLVLSGEKAASSGVKKIERVAQKGLEALPIVEEKTMGGLFGMIKKWVSPEPTKDLLEAVQYFDADEVSKILKSNIDVNFVNAAGETPLFKAVKRGDAEMVKSLLEAGANPNAGKMSPIAVAAQQGRSDLANLLKNAGGCVKDADLFQALKDGQFTSATTLVDVASSQGKIFDSGKAINAATKKAGIENALLNGSDGLLKSLFETDLVEPGIANMNVSDKLGQTALHRMGFKGNSEAATALSKAGADLSIVDTRGRTPLFWAGTRGKSDTVKALLDAGANPNVTDRLGNNLLDIAQKRGHREVASLLKQAGAESVSDASTAAGKLSFDNPALQLYNDELVLQQKAIKNLSTNEGKMALESVLGEEYYKKAFDDPDLMARTKNMVSDWSYYGLNDSSVHLAQQNAISDVLSGKNPSSKLEHTMADTLATRKERWERFSQETGIPVPESFESYRGVRGDYFVENVVEAWADETTADMAIPHKTMASWTLDKETAEYFAYDYAGKHSTSGVILKKDVPIEMTVMDKWVDDGNFISTYDGQHEVVVGTMKPDTMTVPKQDLEVRYKDKVYTYAQREELIKAWKESHIFS